MESRHNVLLIVALAAPACVSAHRGVEPTVLSRQVVHDGQAEPRADEGEEIEDVAIEAYAGVELNPFYPVGAYEAPLDRRTHLTGDWGGGRTDLADHGVLVHGEAAFVGGSVLGGGLDENEEGLWKGDLIVKLDGDRMGLWEGGFASIRAEARGGHSVNPDAGTLMPVNTVALFPAAREEDEIVDVTEVLVTQFLSPNFAVIAGLMQTLDGDVLPGADGRGVEDFLNLALVLNPIALVTVPYSTLGLTLLALPSEKSYGALTVMDTEESSGHDKFDTDAGTTWSASWTLLHDLGELPGGQRFAAIYADAEFTRLDQDLRNFLPIFGPVELENSSWSFYYTAFQSLSYRGRDELGEHRGWGVGTRLGYSDGDPNPFEWFGSVTLAGRGVSDARPLDRFGLGYYYLGLTDANIISILPIDDEQGVEVFYNFALAPSLFLAADVQYVDTGLNFADDAWVGQLRLFTRL